MNYIRDASNFVENFSQIKINKVMDIFVESLSIGCDFVEHDVKCDKQNFLRQELKINFANEEKNVEMNKLLSSYKNEMNNRIKSIDQMTISFDLMKSLHKSLKAEYMTKLSLMNQEIEKICAFEKKLETLFEEIWFEHNSRPKKLRKLLAIDFGAHLLKVGIYTNGVENMLEIPTIVAFGSESVLIGDEALEVKNKEPKQCIFNIKSFIGQRYRNIYNKSLYPFEMLETNHGLIKFTVEFKGRKQDFTCEEILAFLFLRIKHHVSTILNDDQFECLITVPSSFNDTQRVSVKNSAKIAGLNVFKIINELTAAAVGYVMERPTEIDKSIIFCNFGSTSIDMALIEFRKVDSEKKSIQIKIIKSHFTRNFRGSMLDIYSLNEMLTNKVKNVSIKSEFQQNLEKIVKYSNKGKKYGLDNELENQLSLTYGDYWSFLKSSNRVIHKIFFGESSHFMIEFKSSNENLNNDQNIEIWDNDLILRGASFYASQMDKSSTTYQQIELIEKLNYKIYLSPCAKNMSPVIHARDNLNFSTKRMLIDENVCILPGLHPIQITFSAGQTQEDFFLFYFLNENNRFPHFLCGVKVKIKLSRNVQKIELKMSIDEEGIVSMTSSSDSSVMPEIILCKCKLRENEITEYSEKLTQISNYKVAHIIDDLGYDEFLEFLLEFERKLDLSDTRVKTSIREGALKDAQNFAKNKYDFNQEAARSHKNTLESISTRFNLNDIN
jgi:hypothetical protein